MKKKEGEGIQSLARKGTRKQILSNSTQRSFPKSRLLFFFSFFMG